jgi:hypothetical protein
MRCLPALFIGLVFAAPPLAEVNRAVGEVLADERIQSAYPDGQAAEAPEPRPEAERRGKDDLEPRAASPFATVLMWVGIGVGLILAFVWLAQNLGGLSKEVDLEAAGQGASARGPPAAVSLGDAEGLAAAGRFDEAIHALLLLAISSLQRGHGLAGSMTSREVLREAGLSGEAQAGVRGLVEAVEISLFGGRPLDEPEYRRCVEHYRRFAAAPTPGAA